MNDIPINVKKRLINEYEKYKKLENLSNRYVPDFNDLNSLNSYMYLEEKYCSEDIWYKPWIFYVYSLKGSYYEKGTFKI